MGYKKRKIKLDFYIQVEQSDTPETITKKIIYAMFVKPLKRKFPVTIFIGGGSGHGKSMAALRLMEIILECQELKLSDYLEDCNVFVPFEYPKKLDALLNSKRLKKVNVFCTQEGRLVVRAQNWQDFLNQGISDVNALSRAIKRICFITISQFIKEIDKNIRYTLSYYCIADRGLKGKTKLYISKIWKDDRDLENPKLRKSRISGILKYPDGRQIYYKPNYIEMSLPSKDIQTRFDILDTAAKSQVLKNKMSDILKKMELELGVKNELKIPKMVEFYAQNPENINLIGKKLGKRFVVNQNFKLMHDLTPGDIKEFETGLYKKLNEQKLIEGEE